MKLRPLFFLCLLGMLVPSLGFAGVILNFDVVVTTLHPITGVQFERLNNTISFPVQVNVSDLHNGTLGQSPDGLTVWQQWNNASFYSTLNQLVDLGLPSSPAVSYGNIDIFNVMSDYPPPYSFLALQSNLFYGSDYGFPFRVESFDDNYQLPVDPTQFDNQSVIQRLSADFTNNTIFFYTDDTFYDNQDFLGYSGTATITSMTTTPEPSSVLSVLPLTWFCLWNWSRINRVKINSATKLP